MGAKPPSCRDRSSTPFSSDSASYSDHFTQSGPETRGLDLRVLLGLGTGVVAGALTPAAWH